MILKKVKLFFIKSLYYKENKSHFKISTTPVMNSKNKSWIFCQLYRKHHFTKRIENNLLSTNKIIDEGLLIHQNLSIIYANNALVKLTGYDKLDDIKNKNI